MALSRVKVWGAERLYASDLNAEFQNIIDNASSLISPLSGALDWDGYAHTLDAAGVTTAQSTSSVAWTFIPGSKAGTPGTTGAVSNWAANTYTDTNTAGSGTATVWTGHSFQRPTLAASNASVTTTDAATVYIANAPLAGTNETLTNAWSLWVDAGDVRFDGTVRVDQNVTWRSGTSFTATLDHGITANRTYTFPDADGTIPYIAAQADVNTMTSTATALTPNHNKIVLGTQVASTSGTTIDFTSLPTGLRRVGVTFNGVSTNGTSVVMIQLGTSGGIVSTGYSSIGAGAANASSPGVTSGTTGFLVNADGSAAYVRHGTMVFTKITDHVWTLAGTLAHTDSTRIGWASGSVSLGAELDRVRITAVNGTDTFDAGNINIFYER